MVCTKKNKKKTNKTKQNKNKKKQLYSILNHYDSSPSVHRSISTWLYIGLAKAVALNNAQTMTYHLPLSSATTLQHQLIFQYSTSLLLNQNLRNVFLHLAWALLTAHRFIYNFLRQRRSEDVGISDVHPGDGVISIAMFSGWIVLCSHDLHC